MGVPAFFRWLCRKYPSVVIECVENSQHDADGRIILEDASLPNPNGVEFDNLYLDMNGIIHPCTHPEDKPPPKNEDEMMVAIFECIDRIFSIVRPRKLLYMAIDGVAPRAKMNQQRARRFSSIKERVEKEEEIKKIRARLLEKGCILPPEKKSEEKFDSNCITPGTPFMENLSVCLQYYVHDRLNKDPGWKNIKVILSDANVPGEGEHKIMDYIRKQRAQPDHDPNTQHVLCGADADLIMLALATHEPNFTIIREEFSQMDTLPCAVCGRGGHDMNSCEGLDAPVNANENTISIGKEVKFIFVRISVLREYLKAALRMPNLPFTYDFERVVDDWVFMCFFVGNDFLPHLPSLQIRENAIDRLVVLYKNCVYKTGGYLTDSGHVELSRVQKILTELGLVEDQIFGERQKREEQFKAREKAKRQRTDSRPPNMSHLHNSQFAATPLGRGVVPNAIENPRQEAARFRIMNLHTQAIPKNNAEARAGLEALIRPESEGKGVKRKTEEETTTEADEEEDYQNNDEVKLWLPGFKERYYESKFDVPSTNSNFRYSVALQYVRGLCWVLKYYYQGCASWKWYFPYHYAPFASDFVNIEGLSTEFERGTKPFNPLEQLMSVFPAASGGHVPPCWSKLMDDPNSPIIDFYPEDFKVDLNGKKFSWQGVALLPFVDERRLFKALKPLYKDLSPAEVKRNQRGDSRLFVGPTNPGYKFLVTLYKNNVDKDQEIPVSIQGMRGVILVCDDNVPAKGTLDSPIPGLPSIKDNTVVTVKFRDPYYPEGYKFPAIRLKNAVDPPCILNTSNKVGNYKPRIGFDHNLPSASLDASGHRMINHHTGNNSRNYQQQQDQGRSYGNVPPPDYNRINSQKVNVTALERLLAPLPNKPSCVDDRLFQLMKKFGALTCDLDRNRNDRNSRQYGDNRGFQQNNRDPRSQFQPFQQQGSSGPRQGNRQYNDNPTNQMSGRRPQNNQNQMGGGGNFQQQNRSMSGNNNFPGGYRQQNNNSGGGRWVSQAGYNFPNSSNNNFNNNKSNNPANNNRFPNQQQQQQQQQQGRYQPGNNRGLNNISTRFTQGGPNSNMGNRNRN